MPPINTYVFILDELDCLEGTVTVRTFGSEAGARKILETIVKEPDRWELKK